MGYWARHFFLLLLMIVTPTVATLWGDSTREIQRATDDGQERARRSAGYFSAQMALSVQARVDEAMATAHSLEDIRSDGDWLSEQGRTKARRRRRGLEKEIELLTALEERLAQVRPTDGFAWLVDANGLVLAGEALSEQEGFRSVAGHELFLQSQRGTAGDMLWRRGEPTQWAAAAPLVVNGRARGAVIIGWPIDQIFITGLARQLGVDLTLVENEQVELTSIRGASITNIIKPALAQSGPVVGGQRSTSLASSAPFLPLFVDHKASGHAYASVAVQIPGQDLKWVLSVEASESLEALASRQLRLLLVAFVLSIALILFSVANYRTYLRPIGVVSDHLSELQLGRGEIELPERSTTPPFRRLVRLVNMTVQKIPNRGLGLPNPPPALVNDVRSSPNPVPLASVSPDPAPEPGGAASDVSVPSLVPEAAESTSEPSGVSSSPKMEDDGDLAAIIAALSPTAGGAKPAHPPMGSLSEDLGRSQARRSAEAIRGGKPLALREGDFQEISHFTIPPEAKPISGLQSTGIRGGGSLDLGQGAGINEGRVERLVSESTMVGNAADAAPANGDERNQDMTVVATVDPNLLSRTLSSSEDEGDPEVLDEEDMNHFREVYESFLALREQCGERTREISFERFLTKLQNNRAKLIDKYHCRTVRFQVYEKDGKAALKATPVRVR